MAPIPFLKALYCVGAGYAPLTGSTARALGCPSGGGGARAAFVTSHPGLFEATGFAQHPYSFFLAPAAEMTDPNFVPLADLGRLEPGLDRIFATYSVDPRGVLTARVKPPGTGLIRIKWTSATGQVAYSRAAPVTS